MDLRQYVRVLRAHWLLIAATVSICTAAAGYLAWTLPPTYAARMQLYVASNTDNTRATPTEIYAAILLSQERAVSYVQLVASPPVLQRVREQLGLSMSLQELRGEITAVRPDGTVLLNVTVRDRSPQRAKAIADALGKQFPHFVETLETPRPQQISSVKVDITSPAELPTQPVSPQKKLYLVLGALLGLVLGVGGAVIREVLSGRIRDAEDAADVTGLPVLGSIAKQRRRANPFVMANNLSPARAEGYRRVRENLNALIGDKTVRSFAVSSAIPSEGKTVVAANLGIAFAQAGHRVVLVDADLHRSTLTKMMSVKPSALGLRDVLTDGLPLESALDIWRWDLPLEMLPAGHPPPNAPELLGSKSFLQVLDELTRRFDVVILDTPALLPATDGAIVAQATSGVVLVARANFTQARQLMSAVDSLRSVDAHVLGIVVNHVPRRSTKGGYGGAYAPVPEPRTRGRAPNFPLGVPAEREVR